MEFSGLVGHEIVVAKPTELGFVILLGQQAPSAAGLLAPIRVRVSHVFLPAKALGGISRFFRPMVVMVLWRESL